MDDDFAFGNVWGDASSPKAIPPSLLAPSTKPAPVPTFDDFDDFTVGEPSTSTSALAQDDDDFGDFGDFGDMPVQSQAMDHFDDDDGFGDPVGGAFPQVTAVEGLWQPLRLKPMPDFETLQEQIDSILGPLWAHLIDPKTMSQDIIRPVDEPTQLLITPERYVPLNADRRASPSDLCGKASSYTRFSWTLLYHKFVPRTGSGLEHDDNI
jgi:hypothetical protein